MKIIVTGGSGFIGSNFINYLLTSKEVVGGISVVNLDKQTYASMGKNIEYLGIDTNPNYKFFKGDICDPELVDEIFRKEKPEVVFNFAAESHVDRSILEAMGFVKSNIEGVTNLLEVARRHKISRFIQISTDEVYGSSDHLSFSEDSSLNPSSPYSASKASADLIGLSYFKTHKFPIIITRSANNYGPFQFPEKLLPLFITNLIEGKKVPLMWDEVNPGLNVRDWLHVLDNCRAIWFVSQKGGVGEIYNIPGGNEKSNISITEELLKFFRVGDEMIEKIPHRKGHDFRYSINGDKLLKLGFKYKYQELHQKLQELVNWYTKNQKWWGPLKK